MHGGPFLEYGETIGAGFLGVYDPVVLTFPDPMDDPR